jgi:hypothetical protein
MSRATVIAPEAAIPATEPVREKGRSDLAHDADVGGAFVQDLSPDTDLTTLRRRPWLWLNLVCLDAPIVAVTWQWAFGRAFGSVRAMPACATLFLTAWLIYLIDRFADTLPLRNTPGTARHGFCRQHRVECIALMAMIAGAVGWLALAWLDRKLLTVGAFIAIASLIYLVVNHWRSSSWRRMPVKETAIAFLFASGTAIAPLLVSQSITRGMLMTIGCYAFLCFVNCVCIAAWERDLDARHGNVSLMTRWPTLGKYVGISAVIFSTFCLIVAQFFSAESRLFYCTATSAALLALLDLLRKLIPHDDRTALADLVLLTPLLLLF